MDSPASDAPSGIRRRRLPELPTNLTRAPTLFYTLTDSSIKGLEYERPQVREYQKTEDFQARFSPLVVDV